MPYSLLKDPVTGAVLVDGSGVALALFSRIGVSNVARTANQTLTGTDWMIESSSGVFTRKSGGGSTIGTPSYGSSNGYNNSFGTYTEGWTGGTPVASGAVKGGRYFYGVNSVPYNGLTFLVDIPANACIVRVNVVRGDSGAGQFKCRAFLGTGESAEDANTNFSTGDGQFVIYVEAGTATTLSVVLNGDDSGFNVFNSASREDVSPPPTTASGVGRLGARGEAAAVKAMVSAEVGRAGARGQAVAIKAVQVLEVGRAGTRGQAVAGKVFTVGADGRVGVRGQAAGLKASPAAAEGRVGARGQAVGVRGQASPAEGRAGVTGAASALKASSAGAGGRSGSRGQAVGTPGVPDASAAVGRVGARGEAAGVKASASSAVGGVGTRGAAVGAKASQSALSGRLATRGEAGGLKATGGSAAGRAGVSGAAFSQRGADVAASGVGRAGARGEAYSVAEINPDTGPGSTGSGPQAGDKRRRQHSDPWNEAERVRRDEEAAKREKVAKNEATTPESGTEPAKTGTKAGKSGPSARELRRLARRAAPGVLGLEPSLEALQGTSPEVLAEIEAELGREAIAAAEAEHLALLEDDEEALLVIEEVLALGLL